MFGNNAMMIRRSRESGPPDDEIWYYASSQVTLYDSTGVQSHTFSNGKGVLKFASAVTTIGQWLRGTAVTDVKMPDTVTSIGTYAFYHCSSLALTSLPSGVTSIGTYAFYYCSSLALTSLPESVTSIGSNSFYGCWKSGDNRSLEFLGTPTSIASNSFSSNSRLTDIYVPWAEGAVANAPWGATNATIHYAPAPPVQYYYTATGSDAAGVNGNYSLQSGTRGTTSAVYTNGTYLLYYYDSNWIFGTQTGTYGDFYKTGSIEGAYRQMMSYDTPPTVTAYA